MIPADPDPGEEQFGFLLGAYDEALAEGQDPATRPERIGPELRTRLQRAAACLRLLEARRRGTDALGPPPQTRAAGSPGGPGTLPCVFGRFRIERELGRGGCGVVFLAFDPVLRRQVALKIPHLHAVVQPELRQRFLREAQAAGSLDHPGIVPLYEAGEVGGVAYLASAYCPGPSLAGWLKAHTGPVPARQAAELVAALADAVAYTHGQGVLHRDIKPGNVLLQEKGVECVAGASPAATPLIAFAPRLTDFGLAKLTDHATRQTASGAVLGTPAYMAPEQAEGRQADLGPHTDVYALGVLLYEVLTGQLPFQGTSDVDTLRRVSAEEPAPPRRLRREVPRDLETICLKCLEKEPTRRYARARDLADELAHWLADRPIRARPAGVGKRALRWARRRPARVMALALLLSLVAFLTVLARQFPRTEHDPSQAEQRAEQAYREATKVFQGELAEGRPVTLIGPATQALAYRWRAGQGQVKLPLAGPEVGTVAVNAFVPSLLELLPDPHCAAYRIEAELRQDRDWNAFGDVGLYFAHGQHATSEGAQHFFGRLCFADLGQKALSFTDPQGRPCSRLRLELAHLGESTTQPFYAHAFRGAVISYLPEDQAKKPGPWRKLSLEVRPEYVRAGWEVPTIELRTPDVLPVWLPLLHATRPDLAGVTIDLASRGAIGVCLYGSSLSIRRLVVEPLDGQHGEIRKGRIK